VYHPRRQLFADLPLSASGPNMRVRRASASYTCEVSCPDMVAEAMQPAAATSTPINTFFISESIVSLIRCHSLVKRLMFRPSVDTLAANDVPLLVLFDSIDAWSQRRQGAQVTNPLALGCLLSVSPATADAQVTTADLVGTVKDRSVGEHTP
jgi:hypothetical protein